MLTAHVRPALALLLTFAVACGGDEGSEKGPQTLPTPLIEVQPSQPQAMGGSLSAGEEEERSFRVINTGSATLSVESISLVTDSATFRLGRVTAGCSAESACTPSTFNPTTTTVPTLAIRGAAEGPAATGFEWVDIAVVYTRPADQQPDTATLEIRSNAFDAPIRTVVLQADVSVPRIVVTPKEVDFGAVHAGEAPLRTVLATNVGNAPLHVDRIAFTGNSAYSLTISGVTSAPGGDVALFEPIVVPPGDALSLGVTFAPTTADAASAAIVVYSDDPYLEGGVEVLLRGNDKGPCLRLNPAALNFGARGIGALAVLPLELESCGTEPVTITSIALTDDSDLDFALDLTSVSTSGDGPSAESPLVLPINTTREVLVRYVPQAESPLDESGKAIADHATVAVQSDTFEGTHHATVTGMGVDSKCPIAVATVDEGEEVIPQTELHLRGDQSWSASGAITKWEWSVVQPLGSQSLFIPSATFPNPSFEANVAGSYLFQLEVWDDSGAVSCQPAQAQVVVIPDEAIHVELLWNTPSDPDQTDEGPEAGADVDLHFLHPYAAGPDLDGDGKPDGWFDQPFDSFWFNPSPNWGSFDPAMDDDPGLDRDDTDGAGPENLNLNIPENDKTYRVGVHYWHDHGYGPSYVTVRIYIYAELVFELTDVKLVRHDMWDVATIDWPSGVVSPVTAPGGALRITPNYENPLFWSGDN